MAPFFTKMVKNAPQNAFFWVPDSTGENRQTYDTKFKKTFLVCFLCMFPVLGKNFVLQKFLRKNMHFWKIKCAHFCPKNLSFCDFWGTLNFTTPKIRAEISAKYLKNYFSKQTCSRAFSKKIWEKNNHFSVFSKFLT